MAVDLKGRSFLTIMDFTPEEIRYMLDLAKSLKAKKKAGVKGDTLVGKNIVLLFEKTSTRTRCAFEVAAMDEGAGVTFLDSKSSQMGKKESLADTAKVLGRMLTASNTGASTRRWWRTSRNIPACPCTTASPTWTTPPRPWPTS